MPTYDLPRRLRAGVAPFLLGLAFVALTGCPNANEPGSGRPPNAEQWYRRAQKAFVEADFDDAHDSVSRALAITPDDPEVEELAAQIALTNLEYAEALRLLKDVPTAQAAGIRGRALWYKGDLEAAAVELDKMLNDPGVKDDWAKATTKLARHAAGRTPFVLSGNILASVEMVHVNPGGAPFFVIPLEIDGESALALIATGSAEVVLDSATRPEPSWVSLRFDQRFEVHDVPTLAQDLSGISKEVGAPIKALIGVNLLRHLNATMDFEGRQFVVRSFSAPPPPHATRLALHYVRGGGMLMRGSFGGEKGPRAALMVDTARPFPIALDEKGWEKAGVKMETLRSVDSDPEKKLREGLVPVLRIGAFDVPHVQGVSGISLTELEKVASIDLDGLLGAGFLANFRCTFADEGRVLWIEDDSAMQELMREQSMGPTDVGAVPPGMSPGGIPLGPPALLPGDGGFGQGLTPSLGPDPGAAAPGAKKRKKNKP